MKVNMKGLIFGIVLILLGAIYTSTGEIMETSAGEIVEKIPSSSGNTLYVGGSGPGNYSSIQEAVNSASDGDTVFVYDDSSPYFEHVKVNKTINLIGEDRNTTIIDGGGTGNVVTIHADQVKISGFTIQHSGYLSGYSGIDIRSDYNHVSGNIISENAHGITVFHSSNNVFTSNKITSNNLSMWLENTSKNDISRNIISDNLDMGIVLERGSYCVFSNNTLLNNNACGYLIVDSTNSVIIGNIIDNRLTIFSYGLMIFNSSYITVKDNIVIASVIRLSEVKCCFISNNRIINDSFVVLDFSTNNIIANNTISNTYTSVLESCMTVLSSDNNLIVDNTFSNNRYGLSFVWSKRNKIYHNNFINNEWDAFFVHGCFVFDDTLCYGFSNHWNGNYWDEYKGFGPKVIHGKIQIQNAPAVPWVQFDWHPAKEP